MVNKRLFHILEAMLDGKTKSHEELVGYIKSNLCRMSDRPSLSEEEIAELAFEYEKKYGGKTFDPGTTITGAAANDAWFYQRKKELDEEKGHFFQNRYEDYLRIKNFDATTINFIVSKTERVLSLCANPDSDDRRRGLVVGDVQSGKTSNYLALASMACDYGYKVILILAGLTDSLRIQTQERVDEGFVGAVSSTIGGAEIQYVGVSLLDYPHSYYAVPLTTNEKDFASISVSAGDLNKPVILVVKKNKSVLTAVKDWLKPGVRGVSSQNIMIIDDECDNASVNTKTDAGPSTINALIRDIYNNFPCSTYIGYTATPFANIFINPDERAGYEDLFPNDFIHRLHASPESYFGTEKVFGENGEHQRHLVILDEDEPLFLPAKHKKDTDFPGLTRSLRDAICNFLICNCIRTLRGDETKDRSMMINISPFNGIQEDVRYDVEMYVGKLTDIILQYGKCPMEKFLKDAEMRRIYDIYTNDDFYAKNPDDLAKKPINQEIGFSEIKDLLYGEISKFKVVVINNRYKGDQRFDYKAYKGIGARVIAIGGYVLSRGLTLEGLMTSYYSRNSNAYDTLLQMCRWFGYRPNYEDLCRVYMSQISVDSFGAVIDAVKNLDEQFEIMKVQGKTPRDFGLAVKECPDTLETNLLITARNKMKNSTELVGFLNYSGVAVDTSKLYKNIKYNQKNIEEFRRFYQTVLESGVKLEKTWNNRWMLRNVKPNLVADFISGLLIPLENRKFDKENIARFIREQKIYKSWDVVFATGDQKPGARLFTIEPGKEIPAVLRKFESRDDEDFLRISNHNNRLLEPGIFNAGLTEEQCEEARQNMLERIKLSKKPDQRENLISTDYLSVLQRRPVLVILPIYLNVTETDNPDKNLKKCMIRDSFGNDCILGFGIGFAGNKSEKKIMSFRINKVKAKQYLAEFDDEEEMADD